MAAMVVGDITVSGPRTPGQQATHLAINAIGIGPFQLMALVLGGGIYAAEGALLLALGLVAPALADHWGVTPLASGTMTLMIFLGITLGTVLGGIACDMVGRRLPILVTYFGICIFLVLVILSRHLVLVFLFKLGLGVVLGFGLPAANAYVCECCPTSHRANIYSAVMILFALGQMFAAAVIWIMTPELNTQLLNWRLLLSCIMMPPFVLAVLAYMFLLESPYWLTDMGRDEQAKATLLRMAAWNLKWEGTFEELLASAPTNGSPTPGNSQVPTSRHSTPAGTPVGIHPNPEVTRHPSGLSEVQPLVEKEDRRLCPSCGACSSCKRPQAKFLEPPYRSTTLIMTYVTFASNFSYYGMIYGLPRTLQAEAEALDGSGTMSWSPAAGIFFSAVFEIPGVFLAMLLGLTIGRKANLCFSFCAASVCLGGLVYSLFAGYMETLGLACVFGVKLFIASAFIIVYLYLLEAYPTRFRASGLAFCMVVGRVGAFLTPFLYDAIYFSEVNTAWFFVFMVCAILIGGFAVLMLPLETKERPLL